MKAKKISWSGRLQALLLVLTMVLAICPLPVAAQEGAPTLKPDANYTVSVEIRKPEETGYYNSLSSHYVSDASITTDANGTPTVTIQARQGYDDNWNDQWFTDMQLFKADGITVSDNLTFTPKDETVGWDTIKGEMRCTLPYVDATGQYTGQVTLNNQNEPVAVTITFDWSSLEQVLPAAETPVITPAGANFETTQEVSISCATADAVILYTTDGSDPSHGEFGDTGTVYTGPFTLDKSAEVKAVAYVPDVYRQSAVAAATFTRTTMPEMTPGGLYSVYVSAVDADYELTSHVYSQAQLAVGGDGRLTLTLTLVDDYMGDTVTALTLHQTQDSEAADDLVDLSITQASGTAGWNNITDKVAIDLPYYGVGQTYTGTFAMSDGTTGNYTLTVDWDSLEATVEAVATPVITPAGGTINTPTDVTIECATEGAAVHYTLDDTTPTADSALYTGPITIDRTTTVRAVAVKEGMADSTEASAVFTWSKLNDMTGARFVAGEGYHTLMLYYDDSVYGDAMQVDQMAATEYYIQVTQGEKVEKFVYNGGIGGFAIEKDGDNTVLALNFDPDQWNTTAPMTLDIVMKGYETKRLIIDPSDWEHITLTQSDEAAPAGSGQTIAIDAMEPGKTYTGTFKAYRIDDGTTESMLSGFFDKNVKLEVGTDGRVTASFYNTVYAHSMLDFAIQSSDGTWYGAVTDGSRTPETDTSGAVVAAIYTLPVDGISDGKLVGGVNVEAMGGSDAMTGMYDRYTQVQLVFDGQVTEGFNGFAANTSGMTQDKLVNRALLTIDGLDSNGDGFVSDAELQAYRFPDGDKTLDLSYSTVMNAYSVFDDFKMQDISWLKKLGDKSLERIDLSGLGITAIGDEFGGFTHLKSLNLRANAISTIADNAFANLGDLEELGLSTNMLTTINDKIFDGLSKVSGAFDLSQNRISSIAPGAFDDMTSLTGLYLSDNLLMSIDSAALPTWKEFTWLNVSNNALTEIPEGLSAMKGLDDLDLDGNSITDIGTRLDNLPAIQSIDLSDNLLSNVPESLLTTNPTLTQLVLDKNSITTLPKALLAKIAEDGDNFDSVFEENAIDLSSCDMTGLSEEAIKAIEAAYNVYPSKSILGINLTVEGGKLSYTSELSAFDYFFWSKCKGSYVSSYVQAAVEAVLGKPTIDTIDEYQQFRSANLPDFSEETILASILTDPSGTVNDFEITTELQELRGGMWTTLQSNTVRQQEDSKTGEFAAADISPDGRYRLVKTIKSATTQRIVVYAGQGDGNVIPPERILDDGDYSIHVDAIRINRTDPSMADAAINHTARLSVKDGVYTLTTDFNGMKIGDQFGYMSELAYYDAGYTYNQYGAPQGTLVQADVLSTQKNPDGSDVIDGFNDADHLYPATVSIKVVREALMDRDGYLPVQVFVPIMDAITPGTGHQDVLLKLDWSTLKADDPTSNIDKEAVQSVIDAIDSLGVITSLDQREQVADVRIAYDRLNAEEKALVANFSTLEAAEAAIAALQAQAEQAAEDQRQADAVTERINSLPAVDRLTLNDKASVEEARVAYDALTENQKALVAEATVNTLVTAEAKIAELVQMATDAEVVQTVVDQIAAIPAVDALTVDDAAKVQAARDAYEKLTDSQKILVSDESLKTLEAAEARIAELTVEDNPEEPITPEENTNLGNATLPGSSNLPTTTGGINGDPLGKGNNVATGATCVPSNAVAAVGMIAASCVGVVLFSWRRKGDNA